MSFTMRRIARAVLFCLMIGSLALAAVNAWFIYASPTGQFLVLATDDVVSAEFERLLAREATTESLGARMTELLQAEPHDWAAIEALEALSIEINVPLPENVAAALSAARAEERNLWARTLQCARCAWNPTYCDLSAIALCQAVIAVSPLGDPVAILREGAHYASGDPVDEIELGLSILGLAATVATVPTGGTALSVKAGAGLAKTAYRLGALSEPVLRSGRAALREGVDWSRIGAVRPGSFSEDMARIVDKRALQPVTEFVGSVGEMSQSVGVSGALFLTRHVDDAAEARQMAKVAKVGGNRTQGALVLFGKRLLKITARYADEVWAVISVVLGFFAAVAALAFGLVKTVTLRVLRRLAR